MTAKDRVAEMRAANPMVSATEISREIGVSRERVRQILKSLGLATATWYRGDRDDEDPWKKAKPYPHMRFGFPSPPHAVGAYSELLVCADLLRRGFDVYRSVAANSLCDLIAADRATGKPIRIEVRTGRLKADGTLGYSKPPDDYIFDVVAVVADEHRIVYLPDLPERAAMRDRSHGRPIIAEVRNSAGAAAK